MGYMNTLFKDAKYNTNLKSVCSGDRNHRMVSFKFK